MAERRRDERGSSAAELVLYMPILMLIIFVLIQFALVYLGNNAAGSIAREAARVARTTCSRDQAQAAGKHFADGISKGILNDATTRVTVENGWVTVVVTGQAQKLSPIGVPTIRQTVRGPVEHFVGGTDDAGCPG